MRKTIVIATIVAALAAGSSTASAVDLEEGATFFEDGTCIEQDGTPGLSNGTGECITQEDYDLIFGYENLSNTPSSIDPTQSIAQVYNITEADDPASERVRVFMGEVLGTFVDAIREAHGQVAV